MFKARWRNDRNRIKAVFRLQFQASQIPQRGWNTMMVSLVPLDATKPTAKSEKAEVVDGTCNWEKAIIETVNFSRETKNARINEKVYRFLISATELPKGRVLGEAIINFTDYVEAIKPCALSLPLKASNSNPILHVIIQRMQDNADGRGEDTVSVQRSTLQNQLCNFEMEDVDQMSNGTSCYNSTEDSSLLDGDHVQIKFSSSKATVLNVETNAKLRKSRSFDAVSGPGSDSGLEQFTPEKTRQNNSNTCKNSTTFLSPLRKCNAPQIQVINSSDSVKDYGDHRRSNTEWSVSSAPDGSLDGSTNSSEETGARESLLGTDVSLEKLRSEVVILARQVDVSELELQALRKQVLKERRQVEKKSKEIFTVKEERDSFKIKYELLKASERSTETGKNNNLQSDSEDLGQLLEEMKQELNHEKNANANLHLQLQKTQESDSELILAVRELEELLEQKSTEVHCDYCKQISVKMPAKEDVSEKSCRNELPCLGKIGSNSKFETAFKHENDEDLEMLAKEEDYTKVVNTLEQNIADLNAEMELYKKDREDMEVHMEQLALDYEIMKQENHDLSLRLEQSQIREQLKMQYECSAHMSIISDLEAHINNLERELENQTEAFEVDFACIMNAKVEQEKRALQAEGTLQRIKWSNASKAERLQQEFKLLSMQMSTAFDTNEKLAQQTLSEACELCLQKKQLEELLRKSNAQLASDQYQHKKHIQELLRQIQLKTDEADQLFLKLKLQSQELDNQKQTEESTRKALSQEMSGLKVSVETLSTEKRVFAEQLDLERIKIAEMEQLKRIIKENETVLQCAKLERDSLDKQLASMKNEVKRSMEEMCRLRHLHDEKEMMIKTLRSDLKNLETQYDDLKQLLLDNKVEEKITRNQISGLKDDIYHKNALITTTREKMEESNTGERLFEGDIRITLKNIHKHSTTTLHGSTEFSHLQEKIKLLEEEIRMKDVSLKDLNCSSLRKDMQLRSEMDETKKFKEALDQNVHQLPQNVSECIKDTRKVTDNEFHKSEKREKICMCGSNGTDKRPLTSRTTFNSKMDVLLTNNGISQRNPEEWLGEVALLKEKNISMEKELKEIQERYSEISLKFAEVEGERQQLVMTIRALKNAMKN